MQSLSKYNKGIKYLLCVINIFSKYAWVIPNETWVDQGSKFYNNSLKDFLKINNIEMYLTYNKGKSVVAESFIRTLKNKIFKHMTATPKNIYFDALHDIVNKYNNPVHRTIEIKPIDTTSESYAEFNEDSNKKDSKFKFGDHVRISKYKNIFTKGYTPNWSEEVFVVSKIKNTVPWTYVITWMVKKLLEVFTKKNCKKLIKKNLE